jgi:hypothetical protein
VLIAFVPILGIVLLLLCVLFIAAGGAALVFAWSKPSNEFFAANAGR